MYLWKNSRRFVKNVFESIAEEKSRMTLYCPFCHANECERLSAFDRDGSRLVLVMFDCPFSYRFPEDKQGNDEELQLILDSWRKKEGQKWLESLGPVIRSREMRGIERYEKSIQRN